MANENLYLIGTAHIDLRGPERLEGLLRHLSPDIVALEFNKDIEFAIEERKKISPEEEEKETDRVLNEIGLSLTPKQRSVILEIERDMGSVIGYEFRVSKDYANSNPKSRLEYINIPVLKNGIQKFKEGYIAALKGSLATVAQGPELRETFLETLNNGKEAFLQQLMQGVNMLYQNAEITERLAEFLRDPETFQAMKKHLPANTIQALEQIYDPKRDEAMANKIKELYNSGSHRLVAITGLIHIPGLKSRILDLDPTIMTLADYDSK